MGSAGSDGAELEDDAGLDFAGGFVVFSHCWSWRLPNLETIDTKNGNDCNPFLEKR
jgi:hypothetical protein